jgi:hypothetical protein
VISQLSASMPLSEFVDALDAPSVSLTVTTLEDDAASEHVARMFEDLFERQDVAVDTASSADAGGVVDENLVLLSRDGERVATSSLSEVGDAVLFVNSDLYISGARDLEAVETPDVIEGLADVPFVAEGYPSTCKEKFLLIEISRHIEARAYRAGDGVLHAGFQGLSRIGDEKGTQEVYRSLVDAGIDTHAYGLGGFSGDVDGLDVHDGSEELGEVWFVTFQPPDGGRDGDTSPGGDAVADPGVEERPAALVCVETDRENSTWRGFWTFDADRVADVVAYVESEYQ